MTNKNDSGADRVELSMDDEVGGLRVGAHLQTIHCLGLRDSYLLVASLIFRSPRTFFKRFVLERRATLQRFS